MYNKGFTKHTERELLAECSNCIGDLLEELNNTHAEERPKACTLLDELNIRSKKTYVHD